MRQRKVVRYDHDREGDQFEMPGNKGHGTAVAGVILGHNGDSFDDIADGAAPGAKLHVYDIKIGDGTYNEYRYIAVKRISIVLTSNPCAF